MRILECVLIISAAAAMVLLLLRKENTRTLSAAAGWNCGLWLAAQLWFEGYRWQMVPVYLLAGVFAVMALAGRGRLRKSMRYTLPPLFLLLAGGSAALCVLLPVFDLPEPAGKLALGTEVLHWVDAGREETFTEQPGDKRELMVQVWYPAKQPDKSSAVSTVFPAGKEQFQAYLKAYSGYLGVPAAALDYWKYIRGNAYPGAAPLAADRPYPVVLLSHGMGVGRILHTSQAEQLASQGYVVVAVDHTYSTVMTAFPDGKMTGLVTEPSQEHFFEDSRKIVQVWNQDIAFVIHQLEKLNNGGDASRFTGMLDLENIGLLGHSFGGAAAFEAVYANPKLKAGVDMDGSLIWPEGRENLSKPFLFMESQEFMEVNKRQAKYRTAPVTEEELEKLHYTREQFNKILQNRDMELQLMDRLQAQGSGKVIYVEGTGHYNFTDLQLYSPLLAYTGMTGNIKGPRGAEIVNRYVLEFFNEHLRGIKSQLLTGPNPDYPEVRFPERLSP